MVNYNVERVKGEASHGKQWDVPQNWGNAAGSVVHRQPSVVQLAMDWLSYLGQGQAAKQDQLLSNNYLCRTIKACISCPNLVQLRRVILASELPKG